ncbi:SitI6 family double-CXXCG motif immunity protein [Archangium lansingense]|uniref:Double-CXXCG motif protein n=1 Tax=Archangium lansingense TaxID=2995310 RepID=A0ABT4A0D2_9BACT|nr:double-CXXCG motif protein [Archangium lansinium]MCY1075122.1 double-CXXCG motif protein [Archangium lansinium]
MRNFRIEEDRAAGYTGYIDGTHKWGLPGIICPVCKATWSSISTAYPSVDLTPVESLADFEKARPEPADEYERLCELVRPLLPPGAVLEPGTSFGPIVGKAQGRFGQFVSPVPWILLVQREALEKLQAEGLRGLKGCRTDLRFRQRASPELLELELLPVGKVHPDCLPPTRKPPCARCGQNRIPLPDKLLLDASTLPNHLDLFRLEDYSTELICTERFVDACKRLGLGGVVFHPLTTRGHS